jgi:hypothetical protein
MIRFFSYTATVAMLSIGLLACGGGGGGGGGNSANVSTGTLNLNVTDAAVDNAERVLVQFTGVSINPNEGEPIDIPLEGDSQTCQDLLDEVNPSPTPDAQVTVRCIDLLALQGTQSATLLEGVTLDAGNYNWMRLDVDAERGVMDSIIELDDGSVESLYVPSGSQSGLKLNTSFTILAGGRHDFVIDFDLRKSVNDPQGFADYRLKPSLRLVDMTESGNITGTVETDLLTADGCTGDVNSGNGFAVYVYDGAGATIDEEGSANAPFTSADVNLNNDTGLWGYIVGFVGPGDYTVAFTCQAADDSSDGANDGIVLIESSDSPTTVVVDQDSIIDFP